jgi:predicted DsbA family dithiol-disulfide isomerase
MEPIRIFCFSDVFCIWAYIAQIRLDELKTNFEDKIVIEHHFVPVFGAAQEKLENRWRDRGGLAGYNAHVQEIAHKYSHVTVHPELWTTIVPPSSTSCHLFLQAIRLLELKGRIDKDQFLFEQAIRAFRKAFFVRLENISDRRVQFALAENLGLPIAAIEEEINNGAAYAELSKDWELVKEYSVTVSPTLILNEGRQRLLGNVGYRVMEANIRELLHSAPGEASWC